MWCEILVSQPGIEPIPPAVEALILNHFPGLPGESCVSSHKSTNSFFRVPILMNSSKANYLPKDSSPIPLHYGFSAWILRGHNSSIVLVVQSLSLSDSGFPVIHYLPEFALTHVHWVSDHLILCPSFLLLPSIFPSIRVLSNESALHIRWPKHWSFIFSSSPSNEYSELYVHHKPHSQLSVVSSLAQPLHSLWSSFSALPQ